METSITILLGDKLRRELDDASKQTGRSRDDIVRDCIKRQLQLLRFEKLRQHLMPLAEARGYLTDEDVLRDVS